MSTEKNRRIIAIKNALKKVPYLPETWTALHSRYDRFQAARRNREEIFTDIYKKNAWSGDKSVSGRGSDLEKTRVVRQELPAILEKHGTRKILDIPCGDFYWMQQVDLKGSAYLGGDIVREMVDENTKKYGGEGVSFHHLNLLEDELPEVDLVFCRDCLVHFSSADIRKALKNIKRSGSRFLFTTSFVERTENMEIKTGQWRPLNLLAKPFSLPEPLLILNEEYKERDGIYADKSMVLWDLSKL